MCIIVCNCVHYFFFFLPEIIQNINDAAFFFWLVIASIMMTPNGTHSLIQQGRMDSPSYYSYSPQEQGPPTMVPMHAVAMTNGQAATLSPAGSKALMCCCFQCSYRYVT